MKIETNFYQNEQGWSHPHQSSLDSSNTLVLFFASPSLKNAQEIHQLRDYFPTSHLVGVSTSGEILNQSITDNSIVYVVMYLEKTDIKIYFDEHCTKDKNVQAGQDMADRLYDRSLKHIMLFFSGFNMNVDDFISGFMKNAGRAIPMSGGIAGDGDRFQETWVYYNGFHDNAAIGIGFYGDAIQITQGCAGGWIKFGLERKITKSKDNILYEIDGKPALASYKKYLGDLSEKLPSSALFFPLAIRKNFQSTHVVRTILAVDEHQQAIQFAGEIPNDWMASFMRCSNEGLLEGAKMAADEALQANTEPELMILVSCVGRRMVLGQGAYHEINMVSQQVKNKVPQIGFYSYGEISEKEGIDSKLHNQTLTIIAFTEDLNG